MIDETIVEKSSTRLPGVACALTQVLTLRSGRRRRAQAKATPQTQPKPNAPQQNPIIWT